MLSLLLWVACSAHGQISIDDVQVAEPDAGTVQARFTVSLASPSLLPVSVDFATANGTALAGSDYASTNGNLLFLPGETEQTVIVQVLGDTLPEPSETFRVLLSNPFGASIADGEGIGTILDNDPDPTLQVLDAQAPEGHEGTSPLVFQVRLSAESAKTVTVEFSTSNLTAMAGSDYVAAGGTLTFLPGITNQTVTVQILGDTLGEADETFLLRLSNPVNAILADPTAVGTLLNDDPGSAIYIRDATVTEPDSGSVDAAFEVYLSHPSGDPVSVEFATENGTAQSGSDYMAASGLLTFAPGVTNQLIVVQVLGDTVPEPAEHFLVRLSNPVNATLEDAVAEGAILDTDPGSGIFIEPATAQEKDEETAPLQFLVRLSGPSSETVLVDYETVQGTATAGEDFEPVQGTLAFPPGTVQQPVTVPVLPDLATEPTEEFLLRLSNPRNAVIATPEAVGTILDDDPGVDLVLAMSAAPNPVQVGCDLVITLSITNQGPDTARQVLLVIPLPPAVSFLSAESGQGACAFVEDRVVCELGTLPPGGSASVTLTVVPGVEAGAGWIQRAGLTAAEFELNPESNTAEAVIEVTRELVGIAAGEMRLNGQTGLFEQSVTVTNSSCRTVDAIRLVVESITGDARLYNAGGTNEAGRPYVEHLFPVEPGAAIQFRLEFYSRTRTEPAATYRAEVVRHEELPVGAGEEVAITRTRVLADGAILVEFAARRGKLYAVEYSGDAATWKRSQPAVRAPANQVQWLDSGPPKTETHPAETPHRFYRVFRIH